MAAWSTDKMVVSHLLHTSPLFSCGLRWIRTRSSSLHNGQINLFEGSRADICYSTPVVTKFPSAQLHYCTVTQFYTGMATFCVCQLMLGTRHCAHVQQRREKLHCDPAPDFPVWKLERNYFILSGNWVRRNKKNKNVLVSLSRCTCVAPQCFRAAINHLLTLHL